MGLEIPDYLKPVAKIAVATWPKADETALKRMAGHWDDMADTLDQIRHEGDAVATALLARIQGDTHDAIKSYWDRAGHDLDELSAWCRRIGTACRVMSTVILAYKLYIIAMLVQLAVQIAIDAAAAVETLGASLVEAAGAEAVTRLVIQRAVKKLLQEIIKETIIQASKGFATGAGQEAAIEEAESMLGFRDGMDWHKVLESGEHKGISNAAAKGLERALGLAGVDAHTKFGKDHPDHDHNKDDHDKGDHNKDDHDKGDHDGTTDKDGKKDKATKAFEKELGKFGNSIADHTVGAQGGLGKRLTDDVKKLFGQSGDNDQGHGNQENPAPPSLPPETPVPGEVPFGL